MPKPKPIQFQITGPKEIVVLLDDGTLAVADFIRKNKTLELGEVNEIVSGADFTVVKKV